MCVYTHWLRWVFVAEYGLSPVAERGAALVVLRWLLLLLNAGSRGKAWALWCRALVSRSTCGILDQGFNPCPLHWQADS